MMANAALFARPAELFPALGDLEIYKALLGAAMLCNIPGLQNQIRTRTLYQQPVNLCVLGMIAVIPLSLIASQFYVSGAISSVIEIAKIACYYLMLVSVINTPTRLRHFMIVTAACATVVVAVSFLDFQEFKAKWDGNPELFNQMEKDKMVDFDDRVLWHAVETHGVDLLGNPVYGFRMRGLGIFNDPNDVAILIAVVSMICFYFLTDPTLSAGRFLWLIPLLILAVGYVETQSRGGLLAIGSAGMVWLTMRYGKQVAIVLGVLGVLAAPVVLGRAAKMNISDGSGQERIQIWGEGLEAIKSAKFPFGIGQHQFDEVAGHVAHNSYVHAYVELGFVGGTVFFGMFFLSAYAFFRMKRDGIVSTDPEVRRMMPFIAGILAAWCVGMTSLSRCYVPSTYMIVGLCAAYVNLAGFYRPQPRPIVQLSTKTFQFWTACSLCLLVASFVFVKVFVRWGPV